MTAGRFIKCFDVVDVRKEKSGTRTSLQISELSNSSPSDAQLLVQTLCSLDPG
jgi:hypothetical protein